ncbi:MAG: phospho-sugar mutase [Verrucomicrobiota bacterium]|nr:phospho-sugar mutase [Verrucomicrobiota bacterium]
MPTGLAELDSKLATAHDAGRLLASSHENIVALLQASPPPLYAAAILELARGGAWDELNDRFYKRLAFGTGGLRGRTIGKIITSAERGNATETQPPQFPCVGTNAMNFGNISRATQGLVAYLRESFAGEGLPGKPKIAIAHDTRYFSKAFADLAAKVAAENGCDAFLFDGPRSTPELSFAVRQLGATAGIVITASHNPSHDNGYKVYFNDGAQVIDPHATAIIKRVNAIESEGYPALPDEQRGTVTTGGQEIDDAYLARLETLILQPDLIRAQKSLRIVFTPIHGTGGVIIKPLFERFGFTFETVPEQDRFDGAFPTVKSPNPENAEALKLAIALAQKTGADLVVATDPDCDRVGVAVRTAAGEMKLLTGNQIGSLIAFYRAQTLFDLGILNERNAARGVIIKTFVTTDLQKAIAERFGLRCVETLTGFKYIGAKLGKYENALPAETRRDYRTLDEAETRRLRLEHSSFYVFGGEESYGYSGADFVRDKDGNGAALMFCEVAASAKARGLTIDALLDEIYATFGYFEEKNGAMTYEGAEGAETTKRLLASYVDLPPAEMLGSPVTGARNFETDDIRDVEGDPIPKEKMLMFELADRTRIAVRGSGTEPKIKYYLFATRAPVAPKWSSADLAQIKSEVGARLDALWNWLQADAAKRVAR